jgi:DNA-binding MarR family transcriptional regulator
MIDTEEACERRILAALRRIVHAIDLHSRQLVSQCAVTGPQLACLHALAMAPRLTSQALAARICVDPSTLVGILDRLEAKELVCRRRSKEDRRSVLTELTPAGVAFVANAPSPLQTALAGGLRRLRRKDRLRLSAALEEVVGLMGADILEEVPILASSRFAKSRVKGLTKDAHRNGKSRELLGKRA